MLNYTSMVYGRLEIFLPWKEGEQGRRISRRLPWLSVESLRSNVLQGRIAILIRLHAEVKGVFVPSLWKNAGAK